MADKFKWILDIFNVDFFTKNIKLGSSSGGARMTKSKSNGTNPHTYWTDVQKQADEIDELIIEFNKEVGLV